MNISHMLLLNRHGLMARLETELVRARRTGHTFSFALIAVDHFHAMNERYDRVVCDQILKNMGQAALKLLRSLDVIGRIGDGELAIILPTTQLDKSDVAIHRLNGGISALDWAGIAATLNVTFSTGLTGNVYGDNCEKLIHRATEALWQAKAAGPGSIVHLERFAA